LTREEIILKEILENNKGSGKMSLKDVMKQLRVRCGGFTETEAILHMMEALIIESTERRGW
jgi:hypothetical protein